ncbi:hypothetical protein L596_024144 [Steinernema carpocapsae]|uniref:Protein, SNF2 family n=1 Tax=Steinernema carpocapsae TaxID=34508 RepID=A0A4U5MFV9_STECR|nr:hypothetical protein L596_024144 [Steinernema carpocapsae]
MSSLACRRRPSFSGLLPVSDEDKGVCFPLHLMDVLKPHQIAGVRFMYQNVVKSVREYSKGGSGCILAHNMGLGKTLQVITFTHIFYVHTPAKRILIVVPVNTIENWRNEFNKWLPDWWKDLQVRRFEVYVMGDGLKNFVERLDTLHDWYKNGGVLIMGYEMVRLLKQDPEARKKKLRNMESFEREYAEKEIDKSYEIIMKCLSDPGPDLVICDEGHRIKNLKTETSNVLKDMKTKRRIIMTGYPLQNNLGEYFCMVDYVKPGFLGTKKEFSEYYEKPITNGQCIDCSRVEIMLARSKALSLTRKLKPFMHRRGAALLRNTLQPCTEYVLYLRKSPIQRVLYREFMIQARDEQKKGARANILCSFAICSKIWNHPDILKNALEIDMSKKHQEFQGKKKEAEEKRFEVKMKTFDYRIRERPVLLPTPSGSRVPYQKLKFTPLKLSASSDNDWRKPNPVTFEFKLRPPLIERESNNPRRSRFVSSFHGESDRDHRDTTSKPVTFEFKSPSESASNNLRHNGIASPSHSKADVSLRNKTSAVESAAQRVERQEVPTYNVVEDIKIEKCQLEWSREFFDETYDAGVLENSYKMKIAMELIDACTQRGDKVLFFSQSVLTLDLFESLLQKRDLILPGKKLWLNGETYLRFDGSTKSLDRHHLIERYNSENEVKLFLISTRAGSLGINLVAANRVILYDVSWNPCHDAQAICRIYRFGQEKETFVYRLVTDNSMERTIFKRQIAKYGLQLRVVDEQNVNANVTRSEIDKLLAYNEDQDLAYRSDLQTMEIEDSALKSVVRGFGEMFAEEPELHADNIIHCEEELTPEEMEEVEQEQLLYGPSGQSTSASNLKKRTQRPPSLSSVFSSVELDQSAVPKVAMPYGGGSRASTSSASPVMIPQPIGSPLPSAPPAKMPKLIGTSSTSAAPTTETNGFSSTNEVVIKCGLCPTNMEWLKKESTTNFVAAKNYTFELKSGQVKKVKAGSGVGYITNRRKGTFVVLGIDEYLSVPGAHFSELSIFRQVPETSSEIIFLN